MFFNLVYFCDLKVVAMLAQESEIVLKFYSLLCTFTILSHIHVGGYMHVPEETRRGHGIPGAGVTVVVRHLL